MPFSFFFNIGDTVHIRTDLECYDPCYIDRDYDSYYYMDGHHGDINSEYRDIATRGMCDIAGAEAVISEYAGHKYRISEAGGDPIEFYWTDEMFDEYIDRDVSYEVGSDDDIDDFIG